MTIGQWIKEEREKAGLSIRQLADKVGVSNSYLSKIERDLKNPSIDLLAKIGKVLNIPMVGKYLGAWKNEESKLIDQLIELQLKRYNIESFRYDSIVDESKKAIEEILNNMVKELLNGN